MASIRTLIEQGSLLLAGNESARLEAELLLAFVLGKPRTHLHAWPEAEIAPDTTNKYMELIDARQQGEPIAYLTCHREFWSMDLLVSEATLIPRPETELLVERALTHLDDKTAYNIADLGTGSGAIALAIGKERPLANIVATEKSPRAMYIVRRNMERLGIHNLQLHTGSWLDPFSPYQFDMLVSNPPYIRNDDPHLDQGDVRFEPRIALAAGKDGLDAIREIIPIAQKQLKPGGWLLLEHGYDQAGQVRDLLGKAGFVDINSYNDINDIPRVTEARLPA